MAKADVASWLPKGLGPLVLEVNGAEVNKRLRLNFQSSGASSSEDPDNDRITIDFGGSFSPPSGTGLVGVSGGALAGAAIPIASAVQTWIGTPSSANLRAALSDETGTGPAVFGTAPTITGAQLGVGRLDATVQIVPTTGTINDLAINADTSVLLFNGAGTVNLTGIVAPSGPRLLWLANFTGNVLTLKYQTTSSAANRFDLRSSTDILINNRGGAQLLYLPSAAFWTCPAVCA